MDQLESRGLRLVARNYQTCREEIDLVLQKDVSLVFVEVRYRASIAFGLPEETVNPKKQSQLQLATEPFLQRHQSGHDTECRFEVFAVSGPLPDPDWRWIQDAF